MTLKDYILSTNTYLEKGYDNAFQQNGIFTRENNSLLQIFPNDYVGNFFYMRKTGQAEFTKIGLTPSSFQDKTKYSLIAVVNNADSDTLISNLRSTILNYGKTNVTEADYDRELIVISELRGMKKDAVQHALQRLKNETIIRLAFSLFTPFIASSCTIQNPCCDGTM